MARRTLLASLILIVGCLSASPEPSGLGADPEITRRFDAPERSLDYWVNRFETESREVYARRHDIVAALALEAGTDLADIGAGTGLFEPLLREGVGLEGRVYAVDISPRFLEHLRTRKQAEGWTNVSVVEGTETAPSLAPDSVDLVFLCATYHHFTHVPEILAAIRSALRPGGRLVIVDFQRIPGESTEWVLDHVRAGLEVVRAEIEAGGFEHTHTLDILEENYILEFSLPPTG